MTDKPEEFELPDIRVLTITLSGPAWVPQIEYGDDLDDLAAAGLLRLATRMHEERLLDAVLSEEDDDDDDQG